MDNKPQFFIVGAPKCGTTALYEYLKKHPQVFMPRKEIYFFGRDFTFRHTQRPDTDYYLSLFADAPPTATCLGEASVWYLYSQTAAQEIKEFNEKAKIIIMLRRPADMLYSLHSQQLYAGNENIASFEQALLAEKERRKGQRLPPYIGCPYQALYYSEVARYSRQVQRYLDVFGTRQVMVIVYDDFARHTADVYRAVLQFLEIDADFQPEFKRVNTNKTVRWGFLRNLMRQRPAFLVSLIKKILPQRSRREAIQAKLWQLNTHYTDRKRLPPDLYRQLTNAHIYDITRLEQIINRDLTAWK